MTRIQQDDCIFRLWKAERLITWGMEEAQADGSHYPEWAYQAIKYYIRTGRACPEWENALMKADPEKLLRHMTRHAIKHDGSDESLLKACTSYLKRYCGLILSA